MSSLRRLRLATNTTLRSLARRRPAWMVSFSIEEASLSEGLRAASAATAMLLVGRLLDEPLFSWAAIGAFWTCLADAAGTQRRRFASMGGFALLSTLAGGATACAAGLGTLPAALAILVVSALAGLTSIGSAALYQVAILAATACVVMVDRPIHEPAAAWPFLAIYLGGCVFATVLSFTVWRIHPLAPARYATRLVYTQLAGLARDLGRLVATQTDDAETWAQHAASTRSQTRSALEAARYALLAVPRAKSEGRPVWQAFASALADAENVFGYLIAASDLAQRGTRAAPRRAAAARCFAAMAGLLERHADQLDDVPARGLPDLRARLQRLALRLANALAQPLPLRFFDDATTVDAAPPPGHAGSGWPAASAHALRAAWRRLRDGTSFESAGVRHAGRLAIATTAAFLVVRMAGVPYGYWATMATLLVLQPSVGSTWPRSLERAAGTAAGAALAVAIGRLVHTPLALSLVVFPLVCLTMSLRRVSYGLFVLFLTPSFVLVADFAKPSGELVYALARFGNNLLGVALALVATWWLWPMRDAYRLRDAIVAAIDANLAYLASALPLADAPPARWQHGEALRREAGLASNQAERTFRLARMESVLADAHYARRLEILALLRGIAGTASRLRNAPAAPPAGLARWAAAASAEIGQRLDGTLPAGTLAHAPCPAPATPGEAEADVVSQLTRLRELVRAASEVEKPARRRPGRPRGPR